MAIKSETSHAVLDTSSRHQKAAKIIATLSNYRDLVTADVLDIGTGAGVIASDIAGNTKSVTSVDLHDERQVTKGYRFEQVTDERLPFPDASFDIVVNNHVIEHIPNQQGQLDEIARVLRPGGLMYLATPNKFGPMDPHYKLPLISWLPRPVAAVYLQAAKRKAWDIYPISPRQLNKLAAGKFIGEHLTADIIKHPQKYGMPPSMAVKTLGMLPPAVLKSLAPFMPTQIHIFKRLSD